MRLKSTITAAVAGLAILAPRPASALDPDDYMYVPDVKLNEDGSGTVVVRVKTNVEEYNTIMMNIYLPNGFTIEKRRDKYVFTWNTEDDVVYDHAPTTLDHPTANEDPDGEKYIGFLAFSITNSYILPGDNWLYKFNIQAPEGYDETDFGYFKKIAFSEGLVADHYFDDVKYAIIPYKLWTGVEDVCVDGTEEAEEVYDLNGRRVSGPVTPGFYIVRRGDTTRKVAVP